jgi:hypothetical protein
MALYAELLPLLACGLLCMLLAEKEQKKIKLIELLAV